LVLIEVPIDFATCSGVEIGSLKAIFFNYETRDKHENKTPLYCAATAPR
jgi:hypothetical protein